MLILARKTGERIILTNGVIITVTRMRGGQVWLGLEAPDDVKIWRSELVPLLEDTIRERIQQARAS